MHELTQGLGHIASLLIRFELAHKGELPYGWAPRILVQCGVPYHEVWDIFHEMYESQVSISDVFAANTGLTPFASIRYRRSTTKPTCRVFRLISLSC
jgi:hypothetical protein